MKQFRWWTEADDAELRARFAVEPTEDLAKRIGRSISAVQGRTFRLGLKRGLDV